MRDFWCIENAVDAGSVSGASSSPFLTPERLQDPRLGVVWRPAVSGNALTVTFAAPTAVDVIGIFGLSNPAAQFDLKITLTDASVLRSGLWEGSVDPDARQLLWLAPEPDPEADPEAPPPLLATSIEIDPSDATPTDIGRVWAGPALWRPEIGHIYGAEQGVVDFSIRMRARRSGATFVDTAAKLRTQTMTYDALSPEEWNGPARVLALRAGLTKQTLWVPNPEVYDPNLHAILGYQEELNPIIAAGFRRWERRYQLTEAG